MAASDYFEIKAVFFLKFVLYNVCLLDLFNHSYTQSLFHVFFKSADVLPIYFWSMIASWQNVCLFTK